MPVFWLSFADRTRPKGERFLGVSVVEAPSYPEAISLAWALDCNPGGEIMGFELPHRGITREALDRLALTPRGKLLSRAELGALGWDAEND